jgi:hypothetical protein
LKKQASQGDGGQPRRRRVLDGDPPIIVGGGGSTLVWIRNNVFTPELTAAQVAQQLLDHPNTPQPATPSQYHVFSCSFITHIIATKADETARHSVEHHDIDVDRHSTKFG